MRVVAGSLGGRRLVGPPDGRARPTSDRVRESTMNALASRGLLEGARVLDLFGGTGALAIEAVSRGARSATIVEADRAMLDVIRANVSDLGLSEAVAVRPGRAEDVLARWVPASGPRDPAIPDAVVPGEPDHLTDGDPIRSPVPGRAGEGRYDLVFCDPPYDYDDWPALLDAVRRAVDPEIVVIEAGREPDLGAGWRIIRSRRYGGTIVVIAGRVDGAPRGAGAST